MRHVAVVVGDNGENQDDCDPDIQKCRFDIALNNIRARARAGTKISSKMAA
jgi:hypothetical protein